MVAPEEFTAFVFVVTTVSGGEPSVFHSEVVSAILKELENKGLPIVSDHAPTPGNFFSISAIACRARPAVKQNAVNAIERKCTRVTSRSNQSIAILKTEPANRQDIDSFVDFSQGAAEPACLAFDYTRWAFV